VSGTVLERYMPSLTDIIGLHCVGVELLNTYLELGTFSFLDSFLSLWKQFSQRVRRIAKPAGEYVFDFAVVVFGVRFYCLMVIARELTCTTPAL
jgi:hypothetical protein